MVKKINMKLNEYSYNKLKTMNDASIDKNLNLLMDTVEKYMPMVPYGSTTKTVNAYSDTYERLDSFRITYGESRDNIITRMLLIYDTLNNIEETEIPFKLTSPLNRELVLEGICTLNDITITANNDSLEFKAWQKVLNWDEIRSLILEHQEERISFNKPNYTLEINYY